MKKERSHEEGAEGLFQCRVKYLVSESNSLSGCDLIFLLLRCRTRKVSHRITTYATIGNRETDVELQIS